MKRSPDNSGGQNRKGKRQMKKRLRKKTFKKRLKTVLGCYFCTKLIADQSTPHSICGPKTPDEYREWVKSYVAQMKAEIITCLDELGFLTFERFGNFEIRLYFADSLIITNWRTGEKVVDL